MSGRGVVKQVRHWGEHLRALGAVTRWAGLLGASNIVVAGLGVAQAVLVARWLGPERYGLAALVIAYPSVWVDLLGAKAKEAAVRYLGEFQARGESDRARAICKLSYASDVASAVLSLAIVLATLRWGSALWPGEGTSWLVAVYALGLVPHALVGTSRAALSVLGRFDVLAALDVLLSAGRVALVIWLILLGYDVAGLVIGTAVGLAVNGLVYGLVGHAAIRRSWGGAWTSAGLAPVRERWKEFAGFLVHNNVYVALGTVLDHADVLLLGWFRPAAEVGGYKLAKNVAGLLTFLRGPLQTVAYVELSGLSGSGDSRRIRDALVRFGLGIGLPLGALCMTSIVAVPFILPYVVGAAFGSAVGVAQILLVNASWQSAFFWLRFGYMASGRFGSFVMGSAAGSAVLLLTWVLIVNDHGQWGLALATLAVGTVQSLVLAILLFRGLVDVLPGVPAGRRAYHPGVSER